MQAGAKPAGGGAGGLAGSQKSARGLPFGKMHRFYRFAGLKAGAPDRGFSKSAGQGRDVFEGGLLEGGLGAQSGLSASQNL